MEYLDTTDQHGNHTGEKKLRSEVHRHGDYHRTVHVWIRNAQGDLLLQLRSPGKETHPNQWDISAAGHVSAGNTAEETAVREVYEELGIRIQPADLEHLTSLNQEYQSPDGLIVDREVVEMFLSRKTFEMAELSPSRDEVSDVAFLSLEQLGERVAGGDPSLVPHSEEYAVLLKRLS